jgi:hypothetical protein
MKPAQTATFMVVPQRWSPGNHLPMDTESPLYVYTPERGAALGTELKPHACLAGTPCSSHAPNPFCFSFQIGSQGFCSRPALDHDLAIFTSCIAGITDVNHCAWSIYSLLRKVSSRSPGWPQTHQPPASPHQVLGSQACTTTPSVSHIFKLLL